MASLLPPDPPPPVPQRDKRTLPPDIRQEIVNLSAEYPAFRPHELATICFVKFGRKPSPQTIKLILATGPKPSRKRRFQQWLEIADAFERRRTILQLHAEGWNAKSIAGYLQTSRQTIHSTLKRWAQEQFAGWHDKSHAPHQPAHKTTLGAMHEVKKLAENPELGAYRVSAVLASAISLRQDNTAFVAVFYQAVRASGVPEVLVSDNGSIFTSHDTRRVCEQLGIEKQEIKKGRPYPNYIESMFNVQRRLADWSFEKAHTWEDLLAAHEKWLRDVRRGGAYGIPA